MKALLLRPLAWRLSPPFESQPSGTGKDMSCEQRRGAVATAGCSARIESLGDHGGLSVVILSLDLDGDTGDKYEDP